MKKLIVFFAAIALVAAFTVPAMAETTWNFYGNARVSTFWIDDDCGDFNCDGGSDWPIKSGAAAGDSDEELFWDEQPNARVGARVKAGAVDARWELGAGRSYDDNERARTRQLWGRWDFGPAKLLVGKTYSPSNVFYSGQVFGGDLGLIDGGTIFTGRDGQIQLQFGDFTLALAEVKGDSDLGAGATLDGILGAGTTTDIDVKLPRFELGWNYSEDMFNIDAVVGYQTYEFDAKNTAAGYSETFDVNSYFVFLGGGVNFGPLYVKGSIHYAVNSDEFGFFNAVDGSPALESGSAANPPSDIDDNELLGAQFVLGYKLNDMVTFEGGLGYAEAEVDQSDAEKDDFMAYYLQAVIQPAPGVFFIPEIGKRDFKDAACVGANCKQADEGDRTYFGAKWQINF